MKSENVKKFENFCVKIFAIQHRHSRSRLLTQNRRRDLYDKSKMAREPGKKL